MFFFFRTSEGGRTHTEVHVHCVNVLNISSWWTPTPWTLRSSSVTLPQVHVVELGRLLSVSKGWLNLMKNIFLVEKCILKSEVKHNCQLFDPYLELGACLTSSHVKLGFWPKGCREKWLISHDSMNVSDWKGFTSGRDQSWWVSVLTSWWHFPEGGASVGKQQHVTVTPSPQHRALSVSNTL